MKVTRILRSRKINAVKYQQLEEQSKRLGILRSEIWQEFGSISGIRANDREIRDQWLNENKQFNVLANAWKTTLSDAIGDITANRAAAKVECKKAIRRHISNKDERKRLYTLLKSDTWEVKQFTNNL